MWMKFLSAESEEVLDVLKTQSPVMSKAVRKLVTVSADELLRYEMELFEKAELDYNSDMADSFDEGVEYGREQGIEQGIEQKAYRVAERALRSGVSPEDVAHYSEIPLDQVYAIQQSIKDSQSK
jgi:predicted transposase YdaD